MMTRKTLLQSVLLLVLPATLVPAVLADGGKAKNVIYEGQVRSQTGSGSCQFISDTSPIIFYLGTVNNKYHVLLIRVKNNTDAPLNLAKDQDTIELRFSDGQQVKGVLNLPAVDRATWDGLETEIRTAVAYPEVVPPREEEGIYFYVPVNDVKGPRKKHEMPSSIVYNIKSLTKPVELRPRGVAAA
jgi:hypothetical protein